MYEHAEVLNVLLGHCQGLLDETALALNGGFQIYVIQLPNVDFIVEAKRSSKVAHTYNIRSYDRKFKQYSSAPYAVPNATVPEPPQSQTQRVAKLSLRPVAKFNLGKG